MRIRESRAFVVFGSGDTGDVRIESIAFSLGDTQWLWGSVARRGVLGLDRSGSKKFLWWSSNDSEENTDGSSESKR